MRRSQPLERGGIQARLPRNRRDLDSLGRWCSIEGAMNSQAWFPGSAPWRTTSPWRAALARLGSASLGLALTLLGCSPPKPSYSRSIPNLPCSQSWIHDALEQRRPFQAFQELRTKSETSQILCGTEEEHERLKRLVMVHLGECDGNLKELGSMKCLPNEHLQPRAAVEQALALRAEGEARHGRWLLERARYAAWKDGSEVDVLPDWMSMDPAPDTPGAGSRRSADLLDTSLVWHGEVLCLAERCFGPHGEYDFFWGASEREHPGWIHRLHIGRQRLLTVLSSEDLALQESVNWQWPTELIPYGLPSAVNGYFDKTVEFAWFLTDNGRLLYFSPTSGALVGEINFDSPECLGSNLSSPTMLQSRETDLLLVRLSDRDRCSFLVDMRTHRLRVVPISLGESNAIALSGDGQRLSVSRQEKTSTYQLPDFSLIASTGGFVRRLALSYRGDWLAGISIEDIAESGANQCMFASGPRNGERFECAPFPPSTGILWWRRIDGRKLNASIEFGLKQYLTYSLPYPYVDDGELPLHAGERMLIHGNKLVDFSGKEVATVHGHGRGAALSFSDGTLELFGEIEAPGYTCRVDRHQVPAEFCEHLVHSPGYLASLLGYSSSSYPDASEIAVEPALPRHCGDSVEVCGNRVPLDIHDLTCDRSQNADDVKGLECLVYLRKLTISNTTFRGFSSNQYLEHLRSLRIIDSEQQTLEPFSKARGITDIQLIRTRIADLSPLAEMSALDALWIEDGVPTDLLPLKGSTKLKSLRLERTPTTNIGVLRELRSLETLRISPPFLSREQVEQLPPAVRMIEIL